MLILGSAFPLFIALILIVVWFIWDKTESRAIVYLIVGLILGLLIDVKYLKGWVRNRYKLPIRFVAVIYIIYNILIYGFFMGFPVFNILLSFLAGWYFGNRISQEKIDADTQKKQIMKVSLFTGMVMTLICISSGYLALMGDSVASEIKSMLGLGFEVTKQMVILIVLIGGLSLIIGQILLTRLTIMKMIKINAR